jgi:hypothetical protein
MLHCLAWGLILQFYHNGQSDDMEESISLYQEALQLWPGFHSDWSITLHNLAGLLILQYDRNGQSDNMGESISLYQEALQLWPESHPNQAHCAVLLMYCPNDLIAMASLMTPFHYTEKFSSNYDLSPTQSVRHTVQSCLCTVPAIWLQWSVWWHRGIHFIIPRSSSTTTGIPA